MIYAGLPSFCGLGLEELHIPTLWLLLQILRGLVLVLRAPGFVLPCCYT